MKTHYQPLLLLLLFICANSFGQQKNKVEEYIVDTVYSVDTINLAPDPNSITITKLQYDSMLNALKHKEEQKNSLALKTKKQTNNKFQFFKQIALSTADYENFALKSNINYQENYINFSAGINFNESLPFIAGLSFSRKILLSKFFFLEPEIKNLWYFATQNKLNPQNNIHLLIGFEYKLLPSIAIKFAPSIYCGWRHDVKDNKAYNELAHMISPKIPFYAKETGTNSTFDIGYGIYTSILYTIN